MKTHPDLLELRRQIDQLDARLLLTLAQRRFRVMANVEELERALDFPWDKWTVFLHPERNLSTILRQPMFEFTLEGLALVSPWVC